MRTILSDLQVIHTLAVADAQLLRRGVQPDEAVVRVARSAVFLLPNALKQCQHKSLQRGAHVNGGLLVAVMAYLCIGIGLLFLLRAVHHYVALFRFGFRFRFLPLGRRLQLLL